MNHCCKILIYGTALITVMGVSSILPILPSLANTFNIPEAELGILVYSFTLPGIFLAPIGGILADRLGRKAVLLPCLIVFAFSGFFASLCTSLEHFIFWRIIQGCGAACLGVLYSTIIGDIYPNPDERLSVMGKAATVLSLGAAIFPALGGILGEISWEWPLRISLLALPVALAGFLTKLPAIKKKSDIQTYASEVKENLINKKTLLHFLLTLCSFCILYGPMITFFPLFSSNNYGASPMQIGILFAMSSLGTAVATLFLTPLTQKLQTYLTITLGVIFFILSMLCLAFWSLSLNLWLLSIPILFFGLGQGLSYPTIMSSLSSLAPHSGRGILMAVNGTVLRLAQSIGPFICGYLFLWGTFSAVFTFGMVMGICMLFLAHLTFNAKA